MIETFLHIDKPEDLKFARRVVEQSLPNEVFTVYYPKGKKVRLTKEEALELLDDLQVKFALAHYKRQ